MASNKVWRFKYVPGNPKMFSRIAGGRDILTLAEAKGEFAIMKVNSPDWRFWIERGGDPQDRPMQSDAEIQYQKHGD